MVQQTQQIQIRADLGRRQTVELASGGAAAQQVGVPAPDLAHTGSAQREVDAAVLHEPVNGIEQGRYLLHLVHDDERAAVAALFVDQELRILQVAPVDVGAQQIQARRRRKLLRQERALAGLARTPEEECLVGPVAETQHSRVFLRHYLNITCEIERGKWKRAMSRSVSPPPRAGSRTRLRNESGALLRGMLDTSVVV